MANNQADNSRLYIFCDGAKAQTSTEEIKAVVETRKVVREKKWCKEVFIFESEENKGVAGSIIEGVTDVLDIYDKVIVLEDDLLTSRHFLTYMNKALDYYQDRCGVFSISADRPPYNLFHIPDSYEYDVFASLRFYSTGWGTWKDRWNKVDWSMKNLDDFLAKPEQVKAFNRGGEDLTRLLLLQQDNKIDSWAIRFIFAHFNNHAVSILPCRSYIDNIGFDGTGIHSGNDERNFRKDLSLAIPDPHFPSILYEDRQIINAFYSSHFPGKRPIWKRVINRVSRFTLGKPVFTVKMKIYC